MHGRVLSIVDTDVLMIKNRLISIDSADKIIIILD